MLWLFEVGPKLAKEEPRRLTVSDDDFLPPPEPRDNPVQKNKHKGLKTLLLWIVLIFLFVVIYQLVTDAGSEDTGLSTEHLL